MEQAKNLVNHFLRAARVYNADQQNMQKKVKFTEKMDDIIKHNWEVAHTKRGHWLEVWKARPNPDMPNMSGYKVQLLNQQEEVVKTFYSNSIKKAIRSKENLENFRADNANWEGYCMTNFPNGESITLGECRIMHLTRSSIQDLLEEPNMGILDSVQAQEYFIHVIASLYPG